jgi:hypothetical protein
MSTLNLLDITGIFALSSCSWSLSLKQCLISNWYECLLCIAPPNSYYCLWRIISGRCQTLTLQCCYSSPQPSLWSQSDTHTAMLLFITTALSMCAVRKEPQQKCVSPRAISRTYGSCGSNVTSSCIRCVKSKYGRWSWPPSFHGNRSMVFRRWKRTKDCAPAVILYICPFVLSREVG